MIISESWSIFGRPLRLPMMEKAIFVGYGDRKVRMKSICGGIRRGVSLNAAVLLEGQSWNDWNKVGSSFHGIFYANITRIYEMDCIGLLQS